MRGFMSKDKKYLRSPIIEAGLQIRVELPLDNISLVDLETLQQDQKDEYPEKQQTFNVETNLNVNDQIPESTIKQIPIGFLFINKDKRQFFGASLEGFSFNKLAPYDQWSTFIQEARKQWDKYKHLCNPNSIQELTVRYINKLDIPLPINEFYQYLTITPTIPIELAVTQEFLIELSIPYPEIDSLVTLTEVLLPRSTEQPNIASVILDISVTKTQNNPIEDTRIWDIFEQIRICKNQIFESCITNKMRELIS